MEWEATTIRQEDTFACDLSTLQEISAIIQEQAKKVAQQLHANGLLARVIVLKVKTADFRERTRQRKLPQPTSDENQIEVTANKLLAQILPRLGPLRFTGIIVTGLTAEKQASRLVINTPQPPPADNLGRVLDEVNAKLGKNLLVRGTALSKPSDPDHHASSKK